MDCPHIGDNVSLGKGSVRAAKSAGSGTSIAGGSPSSEICLASTLSAPAAANGPGPLPDGAALALGDDLSTASTASSPTVPSRHWKCSECSINKDNWMCLQCGVVLCGRYDNGHALKHSNGNRNHNICMNTANQSVYCYKCDEFVINDTVENALDEIRQELKDGDQMDTISETSSTLEEISSSKSIQETASTSSSSDSGWEEPSPTALAAPTPSHPTAITSARKLRPRKRTISSDSNNENGATTAKRKSMRRVVGLRNLGNTCFMNSVLQSLSNIQEFSCYFNTMPALEAKHKQKAYHSRSMKDAMDDVFVVEELRKVLLNLSQGGDGTKGAISPECLFLVIWKVVPQFRGHRQHDAHEFLRYMLDRLHTELQQVSFPVELAKSGESKNPYNVSGLSHLQAKGRNSIVTNVFGGVLQSEVRCLICGMESKKHDPFLDLSLDIPEKYYSKEHGTIDSGASGEATGNGAAPVCHISDCLSSFTEVEELAETELYYCNSCKCKQKSTKRFWIRRLPNVLCLHIKRFRWNNFYRTKIDLRIAFPINALDMSQFVLNNGPETRRSNSSCNIYDLAAVIVHHGNGSSCGHYTSFAINNGVWMHFNDHTVKEVSSTAVAECKPYILFYIKRDPTNANRPTSLVPVGTAATKSSSTGAPTSVNHPSS
ncbi:ubiquitin carboxyl-terminal hydrolase 3-like [Anopheles bellator]|uniref:ubiquitin carboxyl-terminal hydrolase 3-like n=1 Tax=Anopheles bellator TaxID=139047 RepID=UPI002647990A|nr:ubiquitin carboxyl-terminal hydrolase 3-like [Anopheles bellator]